MKADSHPSSVKDEWLRGRRADESVIRGYQQEGILSISQLFDDLCGIFAGNECLSDIEEDTVRYDGQSLFDKTLVRTDFSRSNGNNHEVTSSPAQDDGEKLSVEAKGKILPKPIHANSVVLHTTSHNGLRTMTYQQVQEASNQVSHYIYNELLSHSTCHDEKQKDASFTVGLLLDNCSNYVVVWLGLNRQGIRVALLSTNASGEALTSAIRMTGCMACIVGGNHIHKLEDILKGLCNQENDSRESQMIDSLGLSRGKIYEDSLPVHARYFMVLPRRSSHAISVKKMYEEVLNLPIFPPSSAHSRIDPVCFYIFTSGTTGPHKAALFTNHRVISAGVTWSRHMHLSKNDRCYNVLPLYHGNGGVVAISSIFNVGGSLVFKRKFSVSNFFPDVRKFHCTAAIYIGEMFRYLCSLPPLEKRGADAEISSEKDHPLRVIAGNGLYKELWMMVQERFGIPHIVEHYGQTEMPGNLPMINSYGKVGSCGYIPLEYQGSLNRFRGRLTENPASKEVSKSLPSSEPSKEATNSNGKEELLCRNDGKIKSGSQGYTLTTNTTVEDEEIVDLCEILIVADGAGGLKEAEFDENGLKKGEAAVKLHAPYKGYTDEFANEKACYRGVFETGDIWYHSGDLLAADSEGFFYFVDRAGDSFRRNGENVSTYEVARMISTCEGVKEVNVYGVHVPNASQLEKVGMAKVRIEAFNFKGHKYTHTAKIKQEDNELGYCSASEFPNECDAGNSSEKFSAADKVIAEIKEQVEAYLSILHKHIYSKLPKFARPVFIRVCRDGIETTSTYKFKKVEAVKEGFNPSNSEYFTSLDLHLAREICDISRSCVEDEEECRRLLGVVLKRDLLFFDDTTGFIPLTDEVYRDVCNGRYRL